MYDPTKSTHQGHLIDIDVKPVQFLEFQLNPDAIQDNKDTLYSDNKTPGGSHPNQQFVGGGGRKVSFKLHFFSGNVKGYTSWLQSLLYPENAGGILMKAPHRIIFEFGQLYPNLICVVRQVNVRYFYMFDHEDLSPQRAEVDLVLEEKTLESANYLTVRNNL